MDEAIAQRCIAEARYMLRYRTTIRQTAAAFQLSKSAIHKDMLQHLPQADAALAREVRRCWRTTSPSAICAAAKRHGGVMHRKKAENLRSACNFLKIRYTNGRDFPGGGCLP